MSELLASVQSQHGRMLMRMRSIGNLDSCLADTPRTYERKAIAGRCCDASFFEFQVMNADSNN